MKKKIITQRFLSFRNDMANFNKSQISLTVFLAFSFFSKLLNAASQTPSQAIPKEFQRPNIFQDYKSRKQNDLLPDVRKLTPSQEQIGKIKIYPKRLIILAPEELQNKVNFKIYQEKITGKYQSIEDLYKLASEITREFNRIGYPLVRAIVPKQELNADQATIFLKIVSGFIEKVDLSKVPSLQTLRTYSYLKPLIREKSLTKDSLERQLILAGNTVGLTLKSGLVPGKEEGGTVLVIEADHKVISGSVQFNNTQSEELGRQLGQTSVTLNSLMGFGESVSLFGLSRPTLKGMQGTGIDVPIRGGGFATSVPFGNKGFSVSVSYLESMTRPGGEVESLGLEANMKSATVSLSYPLVLEKDRVWFLRGTVGWADEIQQTNTSGVDSELSHDRLTSLRFGINYNGCMKGCLGFDAELSRGLEIASRSASEVGEEGTPLSRASGTSTYTHMKMDASYSFNFIEQTMVKFSSGGQYTDDGLLNSEQNTIIGQNKISSLTSGSISGDKVWYARGEINRNISLAPQLSFSPYVYSAMGVAYLNKPTATENKETAAKSIGLGLDFQGGDNSFFDKNISGRLELSKTWATQKLEDLSDVRLNKHQVLVSLAMNF